MTAPDLRRLGAIAAAAADADGAEPIDEATWLTLTHRPDDIRTVVESQAFALVEDGLLSLVVHPEARGQGVGFRLAQLAHDDGARQAWSHGNHPAAARLADRLGWSRVRDLWVMRRAMDVPLPRLHTPAGVIIRSWRASDADELVRVNRAAFSYHPEQGEMDAENLAERMNSPWFDPQGLLVAELESAPGRLLGFHWTKQHSNDLGEVYIVGVDPSAQGLGLGKSLTLAGLRHLDEEGVDDVLLYVESDNTAAIAVYRTLGFTHSPSDTHVMYQRA